MTAVQPGARFGNYRAVGLLGEGGMGAVYLAEHPEIGRKVAVKVLRPELSRDTQLLTRFLNEARAANAIRHPNIIEILDSGTTADGQPYLVMELLEGENLAARLRRLGRLSLTEALDLGYQMASAVGAAHRKGIVHRDLKPDNLFIVPDETTPGRERVKVLDFGIAKLQAQAMGGDLVQTRTGTVMGTPAYMSPEQCRGNRELDARSDIYSLGIILFEMVCGRPPFVSTGFGELVDMHLNQPPPSPRSLVPDLPAEVEALILGALAKKPEGRTQTMDELQASIKSASDGRKVGVSTPDFGGRTLPIHGGLAGEAPPAPTGSRSRTPSPYPGAPLVPAAGAPATTFTTGIGERIDRPTAPGPRRTWFAGVLALAAVAGVAAVVLVRGGFVALSPPGGQPAGAGSAAAPPPQAAPPSGTGTAPVGTDPAPTPTPPAPPSAPTVQVVLGSRPSQAQVVRVSDGAVLGTTPFTQDFPAGGAPIEVRLEKPGYEPAIRLLRLERDRRETVPLIPKRPSLPRRRQGPATTEGDEPAKL
jgi:eukaryotic-like serine/threonine-protein kinase